MIGSVLDVVLIISLEDWTASNVRRSSQEELQIASLKMIGFVVTVKGTIIQEEQTVISASNQNRDLAL